MGYINAAMGGCMFFLARCLALYFATVRMALLAFEDIDVGQDVSWHGKIKAYDLVFNPLRWHLWTGSQIAKHYGRGMQ